MTSLRIAVVTDIHHGKDRWTKKGSAALPLLAEFRRFVDEAKPDVVLDLGDRISDRNRDDDLIMEREVAEAFAPVTQPRFHIVGNHDRDHLSVADNEEIFGRSMRHQTLDVGGWRLVMWQADSLIRWPHGFVLTEADLLWLAGIVRAADRPLAIMSHVPISGHSQVGNYYFERNPHIATYPDAERARTILRSATVPVVCLAGHVHWNTLTQVDGIPHLTLQSLTETFVTHPEPTGTWGLLELGEHIDWEVFGLDALKLRLPTAQAARRWVTPLPPFSEIPESQLRRQKVEQLLATKQGSP